MSEETLTQEKKAEFSALMKDYQSGGPVMMINLNDLYPEYDDENATAASLIKGAVSSVVWQTYRDKIQKTVEGEAVRYIYNVLSSEIEAEIRKIFSEGFQTDVSSGEVKKQTVADLVKEASENWFTQQPSGSNHFRSNQVDKTSLHSMVQKMVVEHLSKETEQVIKDVNKEVLEKAKRSVSQTVSDQLFSGLNLLPSINGRVQ